MRNKVMALVASAMLALAGLSMASPASAVSLLSTPVAAAQANILGKPLPALDYAHAPVGKTARKGNAVQSIGMSKRTACPSGCYFYGGGHQTVSTDTSTISFSVEQPSCSDTLCFHSIAENAVLDSTGNNVVEWGWTVSTEGVNGTDHTKPHLFAFRWVNGVGGTYNGSGWVNAVSSPCPAGMDISADVSVGSSTVQNFAIQHLSGAWWTAYKGNWCGAFPDSVWSGASPPVTFTQASEVKIFGEVAARDTVPTGVQMGSGVLGAAGPSAGARASSFGLGTTTLTTPSLTMYSNPNPTHYNAVLTPPSTRTFRYGGTW